MPLGWIIFCTMKALGRCIILVGIFYQLLIQFYTFSHKIYLPIDNIIIKSHLIMLCLLSIFHILHWYFEFVNSPWILNCKQQPRQKLLNRYRKQFYWEKLKIRWFRSTNNQLIEKTDEATCPMTKRHPEINQDLFSNLYCYLAPKKYWRKIIWHQIF